MRLNELVHQVNLVQHLLDDDAEPRDHVGHNEVADEEARQHGDDAVVVDADLEKYNIKKMKYLL